LADSLSSTEGTYGGQVTGSIAEFGFNLRCLVDERGVLITGHGRLLATRQIGVAGVPVR